MGRPVIDISGKRFGRLVVVEQVLSRGDQSIWRCLCDCGKTFEAAGGNIRSGRQASCGCGWLEAISTQNGLSKKPEFGSYKAMLNRCYNLRNASYSNYGGKGIEVCKEWRNSFETFYRDMGPRPTPEHSIERKRGAEGYYPDNCHWATPKEQGNNRITNVHYTLNNETKTLAQWCDHYGVAYSLASNRIKRGWSVEDALTKPSAMVGARAAAVGSKQIFFDGVTKSLRDWCDLLDLDAKETYSRILDGESFEDIVKE